jgi:ABC-type nickel/cobalt efflux system permease component RcnA
MFLDNVIFAAARVDIWKAKLLAFMSEIAQFNETVYVLRASRVIFVAISNWRCRREWRYHDRDQHACYKTVQNNLLPKHNDLLNDEQHHIKSGLPSRPEALFQCPCFCCNLTVQTKKQQPIWCPRWQSLHVDIGVMILTDCNGSIISL